MFGNDLSAMVIHNKSVFPSLSSLFAAIEGLISKTLEYFIDKLLWGKDSRIYRPENTCMLANAEIQACLTGCIHL